jgi:molecular chaperone HtpG
MAQGKINVHTENIFPIIKKFLYSDHEIFLRELVSNAVDATQKLKTLASVGEFKGETGDAFIEVLLDKEAKTITIRDCGIGMTAEEIEKYITQIAFSGAEEFVNLYKDKTPDAQAMIGHFGLGFYSAFMVAAKVEIQSLSWRDGSEPARWICDGSPEYTIEQGSRDFRGTDVILHVADDSVDFLERDKIDGLLKKYCRFLPVEIRFGKKNDYVEKDGKTETVEVDNIINNTTPAWTRKPADLTEEDYKSFYRELYPMSFEEPLFHIHLNVDYPFNLTGILFFPKLRNSIEVQKEKIQLYCNQVFVTDSVENIVPDFLTLLRGVIDSPDIPLNVSRSYLQSDANVKKISAHITKKVADKLDELFRNDRKDFEGKWEEMKVLVEYGMITEEKFYEKAQKFSLLKTTGNEFFTFDEYRERVKPVQTDKEERVVYLYTTDPSAQHAQVKAATERGYSVLVFDSPLDSHFINHLESKFEKTSFARVDADTLDKLIKKDEPMPMKLSEKEQEELKPVIEQVVDKARFHVVFESLSETDRPMQVVQPEFMRRMKEMQAMGGRGGFYGNMPEMYNLVVNANHPVISKILNEQDDTRRNLLARQTADLALLSQNLLKGEELTGFIERTYGLLN